MTVPPSVPDPARPRPGPGPDPLPGTPPRPPVGDVPPGPGPDEIPDRPGGPGRPGHPAGPGHPGGPGGPGHPGGPGRPGHRGPERPDPGRPDPGRIAVVATGRADGLRHVVDVEVGEGGDPEALRGRCGAPVLAVVPGLAAAAADCPLCRTAEPGP